MHIADAKVLHGTTDSPLQSDAAEFVTSRLVQPAFIQLVFPVAGFFSVCLPA